MDDDLIYENGVPVGVEEGRAIVQLVNQPTQQDQKLGEFSLIEPLQHNQQGQP